MFDQNNQTTTASQSSDSAQSTPTVISLDQPDTGLVSNAMPLPSANDNPSQVPTTSADAAMSGLADSFDASTTPIINHGTDNATQTVETDDLLAIKQEVLSSLSPLVDKLEQSPEEKFRTTMMMIQASDDQSLIRAAYDAAKQIDDEKIRAQALLDIVNEINYFTSQHAS